MIDSWRRFSISSRWALLCLSLAGTSTAPGCGNPGEGSVEVSPESRDRILPHISPKAKSAKTQPTASPPQSAKQLVRQKAASGSE
jgi:hypothetical protein